MDRVVCQLKLEDVFNFDLLTHYYISARVTTLLLSLKLTLPDDMHRNPVLTLQVHFTCILVFDFIKLSKLLAVLLVTMICTSSYNISYFYFHIIDYIRSYSHIKLELFITKHLMLEVYVMNWSLDNAILLLLDRTDHPSSLLHCGQP